MKGTEVRKCWNAKNAARVSKLIFNQNPVQILHSFLRFASGGHKHNFSHNFIINYQKYSIAKKTRVNSVERFQSVIMLQLGHSTKSALTLLDKRSYIL